VIRIRTRAESTVSTVSIVRHNDHDPGSSQPPAGAFDPRSRPQTMLTVLTLKPPLISGNLGVLTLLYAERQDDDGPASSQAAA
jgi:hypothetical protein